MNLKPRFSVWAVLRACRPFLHSILRVTVKVGLMVSHITEPEKVGLYGVEVIFAVVDLVRQVRERKP